MYDWTACHGRLADRRANKEFATCLNLPAPVWIELAVRAIPYTLTPQTTPPETHPRCSRTCDRAADLPDCCSMNSTNNVFLVGPMGAGKSTIGKQLAKALNLEFVDSDRVLEERTGATVSLIFDVEGEEGFRRREKAVIEELTGSRGIVLATGGGVVLDPQNRARLAARGHVVYLHCSVEQQWERTRRDRNRPLLQTDDPRARLEELMEVRDPLYRDVADQVVDTGQRSVRTLIRQITTAFRGPDATD